MKGRRLCGESWHSLPSVALTNPVLLSLYLKKTQCPCMVSVWEKSGTGRTGLLWFQHLFTKHGSNVISVLTAGWPNKMQAALAAGSRWTPFRLMLSERGEGGNAALPPLSKKWLDVLGVLGRWPAGMVSGALRKRCNS